MSDQVRFDEHPQRTRRYNSYKDQLERFSYLLSFILGRIRKIKETDNPVSKCRHLCLTYCFSSYSLTLQNRLGPKIKSIFDSITREIARNFAKRNESLCSFEQVCSWIPPNVTETRINARTKSLREDLYRFVVKNAENAKRVIRWNSTLSSRTIISAKSCRFVAIIGHDRFDRVFVAYRVRTITRCIIYAATNARLRSRTKNARSSKFSHATR